MIPKFRALYNGKMYEVAKLDLWGDSDQATCDLASLEFDEEELFDIYLHEVVLMQFTGLCDKYGVEIYEGDIIEYKTVYEWDKKPIKRAEVVFENGVFSPIGVEMDLSRSEIIGNIWEDGDLLNDSE